MKNKVFIAAVSAVSAAIVAACLTYFFMQEPEFNENELHALELIKKLNDIQNVQITSYECKASAESMGKSLRSMATINEMSTVRKSVRAKAENSTHRLRRRCSSFTKEDFVKHHRQELDARIDSLNAANRGYLRASIQDNGLVYKLSFPLHGPSMTPDQKAVLEAFTSSEEIKNLLELAIISDLRFMRFVGSKGAGYTEPFAKHEAVSPDKYYELYKLTLITEGIWLE